MLSNAMLLAMLCYALPFYAIMNHATPYDAMLFHGMLGNCLLPITWYHQNGTYYQPLGLASSATATDNILGITRYHISDSKPCIFERCLLIFDGLHRRQPWHTS